jgi:hypothetical protein
MAVRPSDRPVPAIGETIHLCFETRDDYLFTPDTGSLLM